MNIEMLTQFLMWCTLLNVTLLALSLMIVAFGFGSDFVYRMHSKWFPVPRDTFNAVLYLLVGIYKILVLVFNFVPWVALTIIG